ncbi:MAG: hypothetical protein M1828_002598 [Chrysothrix sp. TS-e1954]|nr:MAG: hypothetical protein M1828_002598 [Chrysothrix sp. TS-e1954]
MEQSGDSPFFRSILCGRRMFLAALMLASKFLQDRNFTARAWSKITGLPAREITNNEFGFVQSIGWKLHLQGEDFIHWNRIVICCTEADKLNKQTNSVWASVLDSCKQGESLAQVSSQLFSHLRLPAHITSFVDGSKTHVEPSKSSDLSAQIVPTTPCPASQDTKSHTLNVVLTPPSSQGSMASMPLARATNRESSNTMLNRQASETSIFGCPPQTGPHGLPTPATDLSETSDFSGSVTWRSNNSNSFGRWPVRSQDDYSSMTSSEEGINAAQLQAWVNEQQSADQWIAMLAEAADVSMNADKSSNKDGSGTQAMLQKPLLNDVECNVSLDDDSSGIDANDQTHVSFNLEPSSDDLQQLVRADLAASSERSQSRCQVQDDGPTVVDSNAVSLARNIINLPTSTSSTEPQTGSKRPMSSSFAPAARCMKAACIR